MSARTKPGPSTAATLLPAKGPKPRDPTERFLEKVEKMPSGCWEWRGAKTHNGYGHFNHGVRAHRFSYELFVGPIPSGLVVMHSCDNRACVNPSHLSCGTAADNAADKVAQGRQSRKLSDVDREAIRASTEKTAKLAARYNVSGRLIRHVRPGIEWRHI